MAFQPEEYHGQIIVGGYARRLETYGLAKQFGCSRHVPHADTYGTL